MDPVALAWKCWVEGPFLTFMESAEDKAKVSKWSPKLMKDTVVEDVPEGAVPTLVT